MILTTTPTVIYTATKKETITLNFWNIRKSESTYILNGESTLMGNCGEKSDDADRIIDVKLNEGDVIELSSLEENSIEVILVN